MGRISAFDTIFLIKLIALTNNLSDGSNNINPKLAIARLKNFPTDFILKNINQKIIIVMKYDLIQEITNNLLLLEKKGYQESILGHCIIEEKPHFQNNINSIGISIFDICLHEQEKKDYGSVLFNCILIGIEVNYSNIPNVFLNLPAKNVLKVS
jgi:hypothetical protein